MRAYSYGVKDVICCQRRINSTHLCHDPDEVPSLLLAPVGDVLVLGGEPQEAIVGGGASAVVGQVLELALESSPARVEYKDLNEARMCENSFVCVPVLLVLFAKYAISMSAPDKD